TLFCAGIFAAHNALIADMLEEGALDEQDAVLLVRMRTWCRCLDAIVDCVHLCLCNIQLQLQAQRDSAVVAAWTVFSSTHDVDDLQDTMLRIVRRESIKQYPKEVAEFRKEAIDILVAIGKLSRTVGDALQGLLSSKHKVCSPAPQPYRRPI